MIPEILEVRAERQNWGREIEIAIFSRPDPLTGARSVAKPVEMMVLPEGTRIPAPTLSLTLHEAQGLMDELWRCGLRPTEGSGSAGSLAATELHLRDMRAIAMGMLKKDGAPL
jgi:hypothetical protein